MNPHSLKSLYGMPPLTQDRCGHCGAALELGQRYDIHLSDHTLAYSGCEACLRERLLGAPKLPYHARTALQTARRVITTPCERGEIDQAVAAVTLPLEAARAVKEKEAA